MKTTAAPLDHLAQRIAQQQSELENLRREYETRQARLTDLAHRKGALETQLRQVQAEIQAVARGATSTPTAKPAKALPASASARVLPAKAARPQTLAEFLLSVMGGAKSPLTVRQLADEVVQRKFPTTSKNIPDLVKSEVRKLVSQGVLRRAQDQPGVTLVPANGKPKTTAASTLTGGASKNGTTKASPPQKSAKPKAAEGKKLSLRAILTDLLTGSKEPVAVQELTRQAKARGYRSKSKDFKEVVWVMLGQMDNVENFPGKGYRLKRR